MKKNILYFLVVLIVFSSCSIEKRHYLPGYHFQWNNKSKARNFAKEKLANESAKDVVGSTPFQNEAIEENVFAEVSIPNTEIPNNIAKVKTNIKYFKSTYLGCDTLFLKNGTYISAKVKSIERSVILYNPCGDNNSDIIYEIQSSVLDFLKYSDSRKVFFSERSPQYSKSPGYTYKENKSGSNSSNIVAIILITLLIILFVIFLGVLIFWGSLLSLI